MPGFVLGDEVNYRVLCWEVLFWGACRQFCSHGGMYRVEGAKKKGTARLGLGAVLSRGLPVFRLDSFI